jgi:hypothetical protein
MAASSVPVFSADRRLAQTALHLLRKSSKILFARGCDRPTRGQPVHPGKEPELPDRRESCADRARRGVIPRSPPVEHARDIRRSRGATTGSNLFRYAAAADNLTAFEPQRRQTRPRQLGGRGQAIVPRPRLQSRRRRLGRGWFVLDCRSRTYPEVG